MDDGDGTDGFSRGSREELAVPASDELEVVFDLGGRLLLPEDFIAQPVRLADPDRLAADARAAPALRRLTAFVEWVGAGRRLVDADHGFGRADRATLAERLASECRWPRADADVVVDIVWEWAELAEFVEVRGGRLVSTPAGRQVASEPLAAWWSAFEALLEMGVVDLGGNGPPWAVDVDAELADLVVLAQLQDDPLSLAELADELWEAIETDMREVGRGNRETVAGLRAAVADDLGVAVEALADIGALALANDSVTVTDLGRYAAVELMRADGYPVPVVGELVGVDAATLLDSWTELDAGHAAAMIAAWLETRGPDQALTELVDAARPPEAVARRSGLTFALGLLGDDVTDAVRALLDDPVLRPYAAAWLVEQGREAPSIMSPADALTMLVEQLAVIAAVGGPPELLDSLSEIGPESEQAALMAEIAPVERPAVDAILDAVGTHHPDQAVAGAARRAALQRRSSGLT